MNFLSLRPNVFLLIFALFVSNSVLAKDVLLPGEYLSPNEYLESENGIYKLYMQYDGNVVLYANGSTVLWHTNTWNISSLQDGNGLLVLQYDGNIVLYDSLNAAKWHSRTHGTSTDKLIIQNDGNLVLYNELGQAIWASNTRQPQCHNEIRDMWGGDRDHWGTFNRTSLSGVDCKVKVPPQYHPSAYYGSYSMWNGSTFVNGYCYIHAPVYIGKVTIQVCN